VRFAACRLRPLLFAFAVLLAASTARGQTPELEAPRALAALEQGLAAEMGVGLRRNSQLAIRLYCDAAITGSAEGYFRIGRILASGPPHLRNPALANAYLAQAVQLGHHGAIAYFDESVPFAPLEDDCRKLETGLAIGTFDLDGYLAALSPAKRRIAELIRRHAAR
jgi:TPR repeat protein